MAKIIRGHRNKEYSKVRERISGKFPKLQTLKVKKNVIFFYIHPTVGYFGHKNKQWYCNYVNLAETEKVAKEILEETVSLLEENFKETVIENETSKKS